MNKKAARQRRGLRTRCKIRELGVTRLNINRTGQHIYAQLIAPQGGKVIACASTVQKILREKSEQTSNCDAARAVGTRIAELGKQLGVVQVAFDRSGFKYHGRVKALAEAAREGGLEF